MTEMSVPPFSAFAGPKLLASGPLAEVAIAIKIATGAIADPIVIFDNATGKSLDIDLRGSHREVVARLPQPTTVEPETDAPAEPRGRGRPKLRRRRPRDNAVAATLGLARRTAGRCLSRATQAGRKCPPREWRQGSSTRRARCGLSLHVDHGRRSAGLRGSVARLFAGDRRRFTELIANWPVDIRDHIVNTRIS